MWLRYSIIAPSSDFKTTALILFTLSTLALSSEKCPTLSQLEIQPTFSHLSLTSQWLERLTGDQETRSRELGIISE